MRILFWLVFSFTTAIFLVSCGDENTSMPPTMGFENPGGLFFDPQRFCHQETVSDTLFVYNLGDTTLVWTPTHFPVGSTGLDREIEVAPNTIAAVLWSRTSTVSDSLVVESNDPERPRVVAYFDAASDVGSGNVPLAPLPGYPANGISFSRSVDEFDIGWSGETVCEGTLTYRFQVALEPQFQVPVLSVVLNQPRAVIEIEPSDRGSEAYWRVRGELQLPGGGRLSGPWSPLRRWVLQ
ncbi:MAG: hypothetical protein HKN21_00870 [Candidatus Eisenbacteria bacterium]|uniref:Uncharacterized protein n=1 Tax=Eiseniibacteriota bacterium TaxID=2212470 RepID=A0A7Y2H153_UNCEI|nr:hypothetical protein [Candidatus Eisenbacteria bacterium]